MLLFHNPDPTFLLHNAMLQDFDSALY